MVFSSVRISFVSFRTFYVQICLFSNLVWNKGIAIHPAYIGCYLFFHPTELNGICRCAQLFNAVCCAHWVVTCLYIFFVKFVIVNVSNTYFSGCSILAYAYDWKGGWENDETVKEAAVREAVEEAGVRGDLKVNAYMYSDKQRRDVMFIMYRYINTFSSHLCWSWLFNLYW